MSGNRQNQDPKCKLFIGGLNYATREKGLTDAFSQFGSIIDVIVLMDPKEDGKSRGFGFITFEHPEELDRAQEARPHTIDGRVVETKRAIPRNGRGDNHNSNTATCKKIFVANLKDGITEDEFKSYFSKFGEIEHSTIVTEKETGKKRGFGFVVFNDFDVVDKLCLMDEHCINGNVVIVKRAIPKDEMPGARAEAQRQMDRGRRGNTRDYRTMRNREEGNRYRGDNHVPRSRDYIEDRRPRAQYDEKRNLDRFSDRREDYRNDYEDYNDRRFSGYEDDEDSYSRGDYQYRGESSVGPIRNSLVSQRSTAPYRMSDRGNWNNGRNLDNY